MGTCNTIKKSPKQEPIEIIEKTSVPRRKSKGNTTSFYAPGHLKKEIGIQSKKSTEFIPKLEDFNRNNTRRNSKKPQTEKNTDKEFLFLETLTIEEMDPVKYFEIIETKGVSNWVVRSKETRKKKILIEISKKDEMLQIKKNLDLISSINHMNIIRHYEYFTHKNKLYYTFEYAKCVPLHEQLKTNNFQFNELQLCFTAFQILKALSHLHSNKIIHRALDPEAFLLFKNKIFEKYHFIKLSKFQKQTIINEKKTYDPLPYSEYNAPEISKGTYDEKCDIWSLGVSLYQLMYGNNPFHGENEDEFRRLLSEKEITFPEDNLYSQDSKNFIKSLCDKEPKLRPSAVKALNDIWFKKAHFQKYFEVDNDTILEVLRNMRRSNLDKIRRNIKFYLVQNMSLSPNLLKIYNVFEYFDINQDGRVSKDELLKTYIRILKNIKGIDYDEKDPKHFFDIESIFSTYDEDNDGFISLNEFVVASLDSDIFLSKENIELLYNHLVFKTNDKVDFNSFDLIFKKGFLKEKDTLFRNQYEEFGLTKESHVNLKKFKNILESLIIQ